MATGAGGMGCLEIGTQPMAAARANGNQAATLAMLCLRGPVKQNIYIHSVSDTYYMIPLNVKLHLKLTLKLNSAILTQ